MEYFSFQCWEKFRERAAKTNEVKSSETECARALKSFQGNSTSISGAPCEKSDPLTSRHVDKSTKK